MVAGFALIVNKITHEWSEFKMFCVKMVVVVRLFCETIATSLAIVSYLFFVMNQDVFV